MAEYKNYIQDFPNRVSQLLDAFYDDEAKQLKLKDGIEITGLEVTLLVSLATSGFIIPFERLKNHKHPSGDAEKFNDAKQQFNQLMKDKFVKSDLCKSGIVMEWKYIEEVPPELPGNWAQEFPKWEDKFQPLRENMRNGEFLRYLRNALAHGNIFTDGDPITKIFFLSQKSNNDYEATISIRVQKKKIKQIGDWRRKTEDKYILYVTTLDNFKHFLEDWFRFMKGLPIFQAE